MPDRTDIVVDFRIETYATRRRRRTVLVAGFVAALMVPSPLRLALDHDLATLPGTARRVVIADETADYAIPSPQLLRML